MEQVTIDIDGENLTLQAVEAVARGGAATRLDAAARSRVQEAAERLRQIAASEEPIYGVNTGFGVFADQRLGSGQAGRLSSNLILSHATGVGPPFAREVVRAAMLIRANSLAGAHSGVRPELVELLLEMLNAGVTPFVPSQGSLGSSGDLTPLAHLALVFTDADGSNDDPPSGRAWYQGELLSGAEAMQRADLPRIALEAKEGLALTNAATFSAALLALALEDAERQLGHADIIATMSLEALQGRSAAFDDRLHQARRHPGQRTVAARVRMLSDGSALVNSGDQVQDAYSLRCIPQIHGPGLELLGYLRGIAQREINAATDNPLLFGSDVISGGNFHGQTLGYACDHLKLPLVELGALSERRVFRLTSPHTSRGLPGMLVASGEREGLESGLMMLQYTSASLVLESQTLAAPDSIRSLPTSAGQEDLNANSTTAGRHAMTILDNIRRVLAIEWIAAAQALDLRLRADPELKLGAGTQIAHDLLRQRIPVVEHDQPLDAVIETATQLLRQGALHTAIEAELHPLPGLTHP